MNDHVHDNSTNDVDPILRLKDESIMAATAQGLESEEWEGSGEGSSEETGGKSAFNAVIIWLHGLGDNPDGIYTKVFKLQISKGGDFDYVHWQTPAAPVQPVTSNQGKSLPSWFDIPELPFTVSSLKSSKEEVLKAVATVHDYINQFQAEGINASRIIVGGFSQGAATALMSGLTYPKPLAGIAVLWGWIPLEKEAITTDLAVHAKGVPVLWSHGMDDQLVKYENAVDGCEFLNKLGTICELYGHANQKHNPHEKEYELLRTWMREKLPRLS